MKAKTIRSCTLALALGLAAGFAGAGSAGAAALPAGLAMPQAPLVNASMMLPKAPGTQAFTGNVQEVRWRRGYSRGFGWHRHGHRWNRFGVGAAIGLGFAGALLGSGYYGYGGWPNSDYYGYSGYSGYYPGHWRYRGYTRPRVVLRYRTPGYGYGYGGGMSRCLATFRSFDPRSGTYVTYGGERRVCPYL